MSEEPTALPTTVRPIGELFRADCVAFWATTFNIDLDLFNEYLLRRLGDPPLNIVILADRERVDSALESVPDSRLESLQAVNRRWLLRGVRLSALRFHPKSYLAVTRRSARLLVGSGNLSNSGLDSGREVFTIFESGSPIGDAAIATWRSWIRRLVVEHGDTQLAERFTDLESRMPESGSISSNAPSPLWHNLDDPLAQQFTNAVHAETQDVDELHVTAPFYDEHGEALLGLVNDLKPRAVRVYTSSSTSVDGGQLASQLASTSAKIDVLRYTPDRFTHSKLVGAVSGSRGWLLSGSANISHAALTLAAGRGNVELAVFAPLASDEVLAVFHPPGASAEPIQLADLVELIYNGAEEVDSDPRTVRLERAVWMADGRVRISSEPAPDERWLLADRDATQGLEVEHAGTAVSVGALIGPLVQVVDESGEPLSNRVPIEDPVALAKALQQAEDRTRQQPAELTDTDMQTPLGEALRWLHQNMVMDVSEATLSSGSSGVGENEAEDQDDDLWDRLERETLGRDPRVGTYDRLVGRTRQGMSSSEPLLELLDAMRERVSILQNAMDGPATLMARLVDLPVLEERRRPGHTWTATAHVRVRARNVLRRWAAAQTDPRLEFVNPLAPLANLQMIAATFVTLWRRGAEAGEAMELHEDDLDDLWARWFRPFVGSGQADGWLERSRITAEQLDAHLTPEFVENVTALCCISIRHGSERRERMIGWQPALTAALDGGFLDVTDTVADFVSIALGHPVTADRLTTDLLEAVDFIDDELWCDRTAERLGLGGLDLEAVDKGQSVAVRLNVWGIARPLIDPRVAQLVVAVRRYRSANAVALFALDHDWRLVMEKGAPAAFMRGLDGEVIESAPLEEGFVEDIAARHGVLDDLFHESRVA